MGAEEASHGLYAGVEPVQMLPRKATAASLVPSLDEVMDHHCFALPVEAFSVHVRASTGAHAHNTRNAVNSRRNVYDLG